MKTSTRRLFLAPIMMTRFNCRNSEGEKVLFAFQPSPASPQDLPPPPLLDFFKAHVGICNTESRWQLSWICFGFLSQPLYQSCPEENAPSWLSRRNRQNRVSKKMRLPNTKSRKKGKWKPEVSVGILNSLSLGQDAMHRNIAEPRFCVYLSCVSGYPLEREADW